MMKKKGLPAHAGFTLIELLITMAILGLLAAISLFGTQGVRQQSRDAKRKSDLENLRAGLEIYRADCNFYPNGSGNATSVLDRPSGGTAALQGSGTPASCAAANTYISSLPTDPQSPASVYYYSSTGPTYILCAKLEQAPNPAVDVTGCGNNCGGACNYRVVSP